MGNACCAFKLYSSNPNVKNKSIQYLEQIQKQVNEGEEIIISQGIQSYLMKNQQSLKEHQIIKQLSNSNSSNNKKMMMRQQSSLVDPMQRNSFKQSGSNQLLKENSDQQLNNNIQSILSPSNNINQSKQSLNSLNNLSQNNIQFQLDQNIKTPTSKQQFNSQLDQKNSNDSQSSSMLLENQKKKASLAPIYNMQIKVSPDIFVHLKSGSIYDFYEQKKELGEGAYGVVSLVKHKKTKIIRAMKIIKKSSLVKEEEQQLFQEMNVLKDLDHPNIVKLYELFQDESNYYLITEYCSGGELFEKIKQMSDFSEQIAAKYIKQILGAVQYCHERNIVHRDLKPENLLFDNKSDKATLKVIDFGTSRKFDKAKKLTKRLGTPYYIAPEVLFQNYNEKCDVWSCGVILYILLCGYPPFTGKNEKEILNNVKYANLQFDPDEWSKISHEAKSLIKKMLNRDPNQRLTAKQAYNDKWIQQNARNESLDTKFFNHLNEFNAKNKLKTAILTFIATQVLQQTEKDELQRAFQSIDTDGDGVLSRQELIEAYTQYFKGDQEQAIQKTDQMFNELDSNYSGQIDYTEFLVAAINKEQLVSKAQIQKAFQMFDTDGNGYIDQNELNSIMGDINQEKWNTILKTYDKNKDGKIQLDEFINMIQENVQEFEVISEKDENEEEEIEIFNDLQKN